MSQVEKRQVGVDVTFEMIEVGVQELGFSDIENLPRDAVVAIYRAMEKARVPASQHSDTDRMSNS